MAISPRTQAFMQPPPTDEDATMAFEDGFSQLAHRVFSSKFPELVQNMVTFKILKTDIDTGAGIGAFILSVDGESIYVPVILAQDQIKPITIMYFKDRDVFLPLTPEWIEEVSRTSIGELGEGVETPEMLSPDQDIRRVVVPPTIGRYAYAAESPKGLKLAQFLSEAPNFVKQAFSIALQKDHDLLKFAFENFDREMLLEAMRPEQEKIAENAADKIAFLTPDDSAEKFREVFGDAAADAWQEAVKESYVVADTRENVSQAVETQEPLKLTSINDSGFYDVCMQDGSKKQALVIVNPQPLESTLEAGKRTDLERPSVPYRQTHKKKRDSMLENEDTNLELPGDRNQHFLIINDNKLISTYQVPTGEPIPNEDVDDKLMKMLQGDSSPTPSESGVFVQLKEGKFHGTVPVDVMSVTTGSDGVRRVKTLDRVLVTDPKSTAKQIVAPNKGNVAYIPPTYKFIKCERDYDTKILEGAYDTLCHIENLVKVGAEKVKLIDAGADMFSIMGNAPETKLGAVKKLVIGYNLSPNTARELLGKTSSLGTTSFYIVNKNQLNKFAELTKKAQGMTAPALPPGGMPMGPPGGPAGMAPPGMPAESMPTAMPPESVPPEMVPAEPPMPPPPSPIDQAVEEIGAEVVEQSADVAEQLAAEQRELSNKMNILQAVKDRAGQIAAEMSGAVPPDAMPPAMPEQVPPPMAAAEGMAPPMPGAGMPGMEGMPPAETTGMMEAPMGQPMPPTDLATAASPMMAEAQKLNDPAAFEATAIGALAAHGNLKDTVTNYIPTLEEALDSLGRILMTLWIKETELREEMGENDFAELETQLMTVFDNLGSLILTINQTAMPVTSDDEEIA